MAPVVAVIAPGAMGAAVGKRLAHAGVRVLTALQGRSDASAARAKAAGMVAASDAEIAAADFFLSILPPGEALSLAKRFVPALQASNAKPLYVDCNAINPASVARVAAAIAPTGCGFVDCGIIGPPIAPRLYASGKAAPRFAVLREYGLDIRVLEGPVSAASALKMSYAGITKGAQAMGAAMILAAARAESADALFEELSFSQGALFDLFKRHLAQMPEKAYRWIAEMHEIAEFAGDDLAARELYEGAAHFYERIAADFAASQEKVGALKAFLAKDSKR